MIKVFIEAERGSPDKGVYDEKTFKYKGTKTALRAFPYAYGFIPDTLTDDEEAIDSYIITEKHLPAGSLVECEPVGVLEFFEGDESDQKIISVLPGEGDKDVLTAKLHDELAEFIYDIFKKFPEITIRVGEFLPRNAALKSIEAAKKRAAED